MRLNVQKVSRVACCILLFATWSCGVSKKSSGKNKGVTISQFDSALNGVWRSDCIASDVLGLQHHRTVLTFNKILGYTMKEFVFEDGTCNVERYNSVSVGSWAYVGESDHDTRQLNLKITKIAISPLSDKASSEFNAQAYCGRKDWAKSKIFDTSGSDCIHGISNKAKIYELYQVDGNRLYLGKRGFILDGKSDQNRPQDVDKLRSYQRD